MLYLFYAYFFDNTSFLVTVIFASVQQNYYNLAVVCMCRECYILDFFFLHIRFERINEFFETPSSLLNHIDRDLRCFVFKITPPGRSHRHIHLVLLFLPPLRLFCGCIPAVSSFIYSAGLQAGPLTERGSLSAFPWVISLSALYLLQNGCSGKKKKAS